MSSVLGIFRAACYSPGMVERDEAILRAVIERLERAGYAVDFVHEEDFTAEVPMPDVVLHMARSPRVLDILQRWQESGCRVINSVEGVCSVERAALAEWCAAQGIPTPKTWVVSTLEPRIGEIVFPCWVKRTGSGAQTADDVCRVAGADEYVQCLSHFHNRGIDRAVVMEHIDGPCMKFYAVKGTDFFYSLPSSSLGYEKFANAVSDAAMECTNREVENVDIQLHLNVPLDVYGGDLIIGADGIARLIDLNDWPSFSACREEAADAIARFVMKKEADDFGGNQSA